MLLEKLVQEPSLFMPCGVSLLFPMTRQHQGGLTSQATLAQFTAVTPHQQTCPMQLNSHWACDLLYNLPGGNLPLSNLRLILCTTTALYKHTWKHSNSHCSKCWCEITAWFIFYEDICPGVLILNKGPLGARLQEHMVSAKRQMLFAETCIRITFLHPRSHLSLVTPAPKEILVLKCMARQMIFTDNLQLGTSIPQHGSRRWVYDASA